MSRCPSPEQFQRLLADQLSGAERTALDAHVDTCAICQENLRRLLEKNEDPTSYVDWRRLRDLDTKTPSESMQDFFRRLKEKRPPSTTDFAARGEPWSQDIIFPDPPTGLGPLGRLASYHIVQERGRGAYGVVFQAYDETLACLVALKVLRPELGANSTDRTRFEGEARKAATVRHDHVVTIHCVGHTPGFALPYFVMEYIDGDALSERLRRQGALAATEAAEITRQVALGLAAAHARGLVHRDITPANILVEKGSGRAKITDFGLARTVEVGTEQLTQSGGIVGTPPYMSPEQIVTPQRVDHRSDVYSLGVVLYELLTGELPFRGVPQLLLHRVVHEEPRPPRRLNDRIPRDLETICLKAMAKAPARRYATASELAGDLGRFLKGELIQARPVGYGEWLWRWCLRNPAWATAYLLAVTMLATLFAGIAGWGFRERQHARDMERALGRTEYQLAKNYLAEGTGLCEQGDGDLGVLKMVQALQSAPADAVDLDRIIRSNLAGWFGSLNTLKACLPHDGEVLSVAFSPDGEMLLTGSADNKARIWKASTGKLLGLLPHGDKVHAVAFHPEGKLVLTGSANGAARLWEVATRNAIGTPFCHGRPVHAVAFSPDGKTVLTGSADGTARLWSVATGQASGPPLQHKATVLAVAFSSDGRLVITGSVDKTAQLWEVATGKTVGSRLQHESPVSAVAFGPDGQTVWTMGRWDKSPQLWETATGRRLAQPLQLQVQGQAIIAAFSSDGLTILTGSDDKMARLWRASTGKPFGQPLPHAGTVKAVAISADGKTVLTGSTDGTARLWATVSGKGRHPFLKHRREVRAVAFSGDGTRVLTGSWDGTAQVWEVSTGKPIGPALKHFRAVASVALSRDGERAVTGSYDNTAQVWDVHTGGRLGPPLLRLEALPILGGMVVSSMASPLGYGPFLTAATLVPLEPTVGGFEAVAISPDGKMVLTASAGPDGTACLWEAETGRLLGPPLRHRHGIQAALFSPRGDKILTASADHTAQLWDAASCTPLGPPLEHGHSILSAAFSPDGRTVITGGAGRTAQLWDVASACPLGPSLAHDDTVWVVGFSPDGRSVATGSWDHTARVWDVATGTAISPPLRHQGRVWAVAFSPDSRTILTGSEDHTARLWDATTGLPVGPPLWHQGEIRAVAFSPVGDRILTGSDDGTAGLWEVFPAVEGEVKRIVRWTRVFTGMGLDDGGSVRVLNAAAWQECFQELNELGGPPSP